MSPLIFLIIPATLIFIAFLDDHVLSQSFKNRIKDRLTDFWYKMSTLDYKQVIRLLAGKKVKYILIPTVYLVAIYYIYPPKGSDVYSLVIWFLLVSSAFLIRRLIENYLVLFFINLYNGYYDIRIEFWEDFIGGLLELLFPFSRKVTYTFSLLFILVFFYLVLFFSIVIWIQPSNVYSVYIFEYLGLVFKAELLVILINVVDFFLLGVILMVVLPLLKLTEFLLLKICDSNRSALYTICTIISFIIAFIEVFVNI